MDAAAGDMGKYRINMRDKEKGIFISVSELVRQWQRSRSGGRGKIFLLPFSSGGFLLSLFKKRKLSSVYERASASEEVSQRSRLITRSTLNGT